MPSVRLLLIAGLLALGGVEAKQKDKIQFSQFINQCDHGHPTGKLVDLKKDECKFVGKYSVRIHPHHKEKYGKWINNVNDGKDECFVGSFRQSDCHPKDLEYKIPLPADFQSCIALTSEAPNIKFWCQPNTAWAGTTYQTTLERTFTSFSIGVDGHAHPSVYTATFGATRTSYGANVAPRAEPTGLPLEPRGKPEYNVKSVWMKHPWAHSDICYRCWTKKPNNFDKWSCRSGPKYYANCGPKPAPAPPTSTYTAIATTTFEVYVTSVEQAQGARTASETIPTAAASKRSPHMRVVLSNPYNPATLVCADAEWENAGKPKAEVRIQKIKPFHKCDSKNPLPINVGQPLHITTQFATRTVVDTLTYRPTWAPHH